MNRLLLTLAACLLGAVISLSTGCVKMKTMLAPAAEPAAPPHAEMGEFWQNKVKEFRADNAKQQPGGIVLVGDSITQNCPEKELFPGLSVVNRGVSGDRIIGVIQRLDVSVYELKPTKVFLLVGINDTLFPEMKLPEYEAQYDYLLTQIKQHCPESEVYVQSVLPVYGQFAHNNPMVVQINKMLKQVARRHGCKFVNTHRLFSASNGEMRHNLAADGVHPNREGYEIWKKTLLPLMED